MSDLNPHEEAVIRQLFAHDRRLEFLRGISGTAKSRARALWNLAHFYDWEPRCTVLEVPKSKRTVDGISDLLRERGAPSTCHLMSNYPYIDGHDMDLREAVKAALEAWPHSTIISCKPGKLAFYQGEYVEEAYIVTR